MGVVFSGVRQDVPRSWIVDKVDAEGRRVAVCCIVRCSACSSLCCSVLQRVAAWCFRVFGKMFGVVGLLTRWMLRVVVLQYVAVRVVVLQCAAVHVAVCIAPCVVMCDACCSVYCTVCGNVCCSV